MEFELSYSSIGTGCRLGFLAYTDAVRNMRMAQILQVSAVSSNIVDGENRRVEMVQMAGPTIEYVHSHCRVYRSSFPLITLTLFHQVVFVRHPLLTRLRCLMEFHFQHANAMLYPLFCDNITKIVASESNQFTVGCLIPGEAMLCRKSNVVYTTAFVSLLTYCTFPAAP
uniref:Uncharacterized protein n=1 Tax=Angiostrongylus cantonensis TaxID=6313 RepID=A0A0K0DRT6_ANGCA